MKEFIIAIIGLIATVFSVYLAASFNLAQKQLVAATRLQAYLRNSGMWVVETGLFPLFRLGQEWYEEATKVILSGGGPEGLVKLQEEKRKQIDEIVETWKKNEQASLLNHEILSKFKRLPKEQTLTTMADYAKLHRQNIILGHTFITDEEASILGLAMAANAISLKMGVVDLLDRSLFVTASAVSQPDQFAPEEYVDDMKKLLWRATVVSKEHCTLSRAAESFTSKTLLGLTIRNMKLGSRVTKR